MTWLLDTNVLSELRKGARCDPNLRRWVSEVDPEAMFTSVLVLGEIRRGIDRLRHRDAVQARLLSEWHHRVRLAFAGRVLEINEAVAETWGALDSKTPRPVIDALLAATALVYGLTLVTRNHRDVRGTGAKVFDPFHAR